MRGAGRKAPQGILRGGKGKRKGAWGKVLLGLVTCCQLALSLLLAAQRRREVVCAVRDQEEKVQVLLAQKKTTKEIGG